MLAHCIVILKYAYFFLYNPLPAVTKERWLVNLLLLPSLQLIHLIQKEPKNLLYHQD